MSSACAKLTPGAVRVIDARGVVPVEKEWGGSYDEARTGADRASVPRGVGRARGSVRGLGASSRLEEPLLQRVARGDQDAVRACLDRFGGLVWSLARRMTPTHAEAEDAVQEIFVEVWKNAYRYDASVASETAFVAMIARRRLIDRRRRAVRQLDRHGLPESEPAATPASEMSADEREVANAAMSAMSRLSDEQQRVLRLSLVQGLSHERIAGATGLPLGTVKTHARRGLIRLRELLTAAKRDVNGSGAAGEGGAS